MAKFDFITTLPFRASLESDYAEMNNNIQNQSWKAAQILAGSIVEAVLIDYLVTAKSTIMGGKDPLKLDLAEAIEICLKNKVISQRTSDLCSVVRSYRNLIHPGRQIRLDETPPSQQSAGIASSLVDIIIEEVVKVRKGQFGFTAEQIVAKLENDHNSVALLPHLLKEVHEVELERLLLSVLPSRYTTLNSQGDDEWGNIQTACNRLSKGFRIAFTSSSDTQKKKSAAAFVQILKTEEGYNVDQYTKAFFEPRDMSYLDTKDKPIVKEYYLSQQGSNHNPESAALAAPLASFLDPADMVRWLDPFIRSIISTKLDVSERASIKTSLEFVQDELSDACEKAHDNRVNAWIAFLKPKQPDQAETLAELLVELQAARLPF